MSTATQNFINAQRALHGDEYVDELINGKYLPALTSAGWRWIYVADENYAHYVNTALDTAGIV